MEKKLLSAIFFMFMISCAQGYQFDLGAASDGFVQNIVYNNKVDIIWIVDNSSSMLQHQTRLIQQVPALVSQLNTLKMDYHMSVISTSMGGANPNGGRFIGTPKYISNESSDVVSILSEKLNLGQNGSNNERGLESLENVLSNSYLTGEGSGFFRKDALLVVIALTDEDDKSGYSAEHYESILNAIKPDFENGEKAWIFNFIGVLNLSSACRTFNNYSEPGSIFMSLADYSNGIKESICSDTLTTAVSNIHARIVSQITEYKLNQVPILSSVVVKINGILIPQNTINGWSYNSSLNVIRFNGSAVPPADAKVIVDFKPATNN